LDTSKPVAIVGFASSSRHQTPFADEGLEIWSMNHAPLSWLPRWDVLFELHTLEHLQRTTAHLTEPSAYLDWLKKQPGPGQDGYRPIYTQDVFPVIPASIKMPREELNAWFAERGQNLKGYYAADYYTSTVSFMLALAIMQGRPKIHIYGVDLLQDEEYSYQRAGCEYLVGFARGMGIPVFVPEQSALCQANYTYGFSEPAVAGQLDPFIKYIEDKAGVSEGMMTKARQDAHTFNGALQMADLAIKLIETGGEDGKNASICIKEKREEMLKRFRQAENASVSLTGQTEAFKTTVVWAKHFARGGALVS